ncbi:hypothetical protein SteCoe_8720 [Stentor coeruleus]|uniref:Uncharacterized protein n=1 Tax=Stentor coeruleus TaxID=5963 RepID=A0A1R2CJG3_9CILI|nr:hypothetical protein SteCoe_8720 [Stentor coeruleus]
MARKEHKGKHLTLPIHDITNENDIFASQIRKSISFSEENSENFNLRLHVKSLAETCEINFEDTCTPRFCNTVDFPAFEKRILDETHELVPDEQDSNGMRQKKVLVFPCKEEITERDTLKTEEVLELFCIGPQSNSNTICSCNIF